MSKKQILEKFYQEYLTRLVAVEVDLRFLEGKDDNDIYDQVLTEKNSLLGGKPVVRNITVRQQRELLEKLKNQLEERIKVIQSMLADQHYK